MEKRSLAPRLVFLFALAILGSTGLARAQSFPSKAVTLYCPAAAGSSTDVLGRVVATQLQERLKQTFVMENRPGAGGSLAAEAMVRAAPDGHTLMFGANVFLVFEVFVKNSSVKVRDLAPIAAVQYDPYLLVTAPS